VYITIDNGVVGTTGAITAAHVHALLVAYGVQVVGSTSDSASAALLTLPAELSKLLGRVITGGGCTLHTLNLTLEVPYTFVYGLSILGKPSVLILVRTVRWLQRRCFEADLALAAKLGIAYPTTRIQEAVLTRWATFIRAVVYLCNNWNAIVALAVARYDSLPSDSRKKREMYGLVAWWMGRCPKLRADTLFVRCFGMATFMPRYQFLIDADSRSGRVSGFMAPKVARHYVNYSRELAQLKDGGWATGRGYKRFVAQLALLTPDEREVGTGQANSFIEQAAARNAAHTVPWLRDRIYTSIGDDVCVAVPLARVLLAAAAAAATPVAAAAAAGDRDAAVCAAVASSISLVPQGQCMRVDGVVYELKGLLADMCAGITTAAAGRSWPLM
jgi:hypothetical protein